MRLEKLRDFVANVLDYDPNVEVYKEQINDFLNASYFKLFTEHLFSFAQREEIIPVYGDLNITGVTLTTGSETITLATAQVTPLVHNGMIITIDEVDYEIAWVETTTKFHLTEKYAGSTTPTTATIKHRFIYLPSDCVKVMQIMVRSNTLNTTLGGNLESITRYDDGYWNLPLDDSNIPQMWVPYDDFNLTAPKAPQVVASTAASGHGTRTLEFAVTYLYAGVESSLSPSVEVVLADNQIAELTIKARPNVSGRLYKVYVRNKAFSNKFYHVEDNGGNAYFTPIQAGTFLYDLDATDFDDSFELINYRYPETEGNAQRIRLYPRQSTDSNITVRYIYRPELLLDDSDSPNFDAVYHNILGYMSLSDIFAKHDNLPQASIYRTKAKQEMLKLENRFLNRTTKRHIKGHMNAGVIERRMIIGRVNKL